MPNSMAAKTKEPAPTSAESASKEIVCGRCEKAKPANLDNFYSSKYSPSGFYSICKLCKRSKAKREDKFKTCRKCLTRKDISEFYEGRSVCSRCRCKRTYEISDKEKAKEAHKRWRTRNSRKHNEASSAWKAKNRERTRRTNLEWARKNKDLVRAKDHRRRAAKARVIPPWFNKEECQKVYSEALEMEALTGIEFEVDHIVPLQGKTVSGLHCQQNLQAIPKYKNRSKGNRIWPNMWK